MPFEHMQDFFVRHVVKVGVKRSHRERWEFLDNEAVDLVKVRLDST
jgi:hypothetical protein